MYSSLFVTMMGIGTVFFGLICIIFLTMGMGAILKSNKPAAAAPAAAPAPVAAAPAAPAVNTAKQQEVIAAVAAALSEELGPRANGMTILDIQKL